MPQNYDWDQVLVAGDSGGRRRRTRSFSDRCSTLLLPSHWTGYKWPPLLSSFEAFVSLLGLIFAGTFIDLNLFFLKAQLWLEPSHWILLTRTVFMSFAATAGTRDIFEFVTNPAGKMGMQGWLDLAIVLSELMVAMRFWHVFKPTTPMPTFVKAAWIAFGVAVAGTSLRLYIVRARRIAAAQKMPEDGTVTSHHDGETAAASFGRLKQA